MKITEDPDKFLYSWRKVELARYVPSLSRVIREKDGDLPVLIDVKDISTYREKHSNTGLYTSIWYYNSDSIDSSTRFGPLYFDIDNADIGESYRESLTLYEHLAENIPSDQIVIYFTGKKGFHIECDPITLGINPSNNLPNIFRSIANSIVNKLSLSSVDFSVYDARRMWRLPGSKHQDTGLYKTLLPKQVFYDGIDSIIQYSSVIQDMEEAEPSFSAKANEWYRNYMYEAEIDKERSKDFIAYFNKHGSSAFKDSHSFDLDKEFTPKRLMDGCPAIRRLWQQAIDTGFLEHEARLFLCSLLTYNEDSIKFLHGILSNCDDYNFEKSSSHIQDWIKRRDIGIGGRPYTCSRANSAGVGCGDCSLEEKKKWLKVGDRYVESEETSQPSPVRFAYSTVKKGGEPNGK